MDEKKYKYILDVKNLERNYYTMTPGGNRITYSVLKGVSFQVKPGEFIGIMGSSGCGKTTLLKTLGMLDKPNGGRVLYKGTPVEEIYGDRLAEIRRKELAFIFQDYYLMNSLTVKENIMMPLILNEDDPKKSDQAARCEAKRFGIEGLLDKKPYELSGGEKQRTSICRAMVANPELILADEPTGNLDSKSSMQVIQTLFYINKQFGKTLCLVTHDPKMASYCDRILFIKDGKLFSELVRGEDDRKVFFDRIIEVVTLLGGDVNNVL